MLPVLNVCCALILQPGQQAPLILAAKKAAGSTNAGLYEFPGGKIEPGESPQEAIAREIIEELNYPVTPERVLPPVDHIEPTRTIRLIPITCTPAATSLPIPLEHESVGFFTLKTAQTLPWGPADRIILTQLIAGTSDE